MTFSPFTLHIPRRRLFLSTRLLAALTASLALVTHASADWTTPSSYSNPVQTVRIGDPGYEVDLTDDFDDDTDAFQDAIDYVSNNGGGHVNVPQGTYRFLEVQLKSDVHLIFQNGCTLYPYTANRDPNDQTNVIMLHLGKLEAIENVSVRSVGPTRTKFMLEGYFNLLQAISCADVRNFEIRRFDFVDTKTAKASVGLTWRQSTANGSSLNQNRIPIDGSFRWLKNTDAHFGFGTIQANAGDNIHFQGIESVGGVALRLETDWKAMTLADYNDNDPDLDLGLSNIYANNITSRDGQSAIKLAPHALDNGSVTINGVYSYNSLYAIEIMEGSLHKFTEYSYMQPGTFSSITINNVTAEYTAGPVVVAWHNLLHYHEDLHHLVYDNGGPDLSYRGPMNVPIELKQWRGPSIAPILNERHPDPAVVINESSILKIGYPSFINKVWTPTDFFTGTPQQVLADDTPPDP